MENSEVPRLRWPPSTQAILGPNSYSCLNKEKLEEADLCDVLSLGQFTPRIMPQLPCHRNWTLPACPPLQGRQKCDHCDSFSPFCLSCICSQGLLIIANWKDWFGYKHRVAQYKVFLCRSLLIDLQSFPFQLEKWCSSLPFLEKAMISVWVMSGIKYIFK